MTAYMLDTDISRYIIKRRTASFAERFEKSADALCVSAMTAAELRLDAEKAARRDLLELGEGFLERLAILDWTADVSFHYAKIRAAVELAVKPIGNMDLLIAGQSTGNADQVSIMTSSATTLTLSITCRPEIILFSMSG